VPRHGDVQSLLQYVAGAGHQRTHCPKQAAQLISLAAANDDINVLDAKYVTKHKHLAAGNVYLQGLTHCIKIWPLRTAVPDWPQTAERPIFLQISQQRDLFSYK